MSIHFPVRFLTDACPSLGPAWLHLFAQENQEDILLTPTDIQALLDIVDEMHRTEATLKTELSETKTDNTSTLIPNPSPLENSSEL